jgi:hypothetical protein
MLHNTQEASSKPSENEKTLLLLRKNKENNERDTEAQLSKMRGESGANERWLLGNIAIRTGESSLRKSNSHN